MPGIDTSVAVVLLRLNHHCEVGAVRTLGRLGVPVYAVHDDLGSPAARSRYVREILPWSLDRTPEADSVEAFLEFGRRIGGRPVLLASDDRTGDFLADHAEALATVFRFPDQPPGLARALSSKKELDGLCRRYGIPTPEARFPTSRVELLDAAETLKFPVVLKGIDAYQLHERVGLRMAIAADVDELLRLYDAMEDPAEPNLMAQEYIPGGPESVWMLDGYFDSDSVGHVVAAGQKLRQFPVDTGMTSLGICTPNVEVEAMTRRFMKQLGYRGVLDLGYRYDRRDGRYKLLDVNPRLGSTFRLFAHEPALDVVRALYLDLTGQPIPASRAVSGRRWLVEDFDLASALVTYRRGELTLREWLGSLRGVQETGWFALDDPLPMAVTARRALQRYRTSRWRGWSPASSAQRAFGAL